MRRNVGQEQLIAAACDRQPDTRPSNPNGVVMPECRRNRRTPPSALESEALTVRSSAASSIVNKSDVYTHPTPSPVFARRKAGALPCPDSQGTAAALLRTPQWPTPGSDMFDHFANIVALSTPPYRLRMIMRLSFYLHPEFLMYQPSSRRISPACNLPHTKLHRVRDQENRGLTLY